MPPKKISKPPFLDADAIQSLLQRRAPLKKFWLAPGSLLLIRGYPTRSDPVYEIQLAYDLGERLETYRWLWIDALEGKILKTFPENS